MKNTLAVDPVTPFEARQCGHAPGASWVEGPLPIAQSERRNGGCSCCSRRFDGHADSWESDVVKGAMSRRQFGLQSTASGCFAVIIVAVSLSVVGLAVNPAERGRPVEVHVSERAEE